MSEIEKDLELVRLSSEGPWRTSDAHGLCVVQDESHLDDTAMIADMDPAGTTKGWTGKREDAEFIARAKSRWPRSASTLRCIKVALKMEISDADFRRVVSDFIDAVDDQ